MQKKYEVAVVGGGIAGYTAVLTLKSMNVDYLWLGERGFGEKLRKAEYVRNFPAFTGNGEQFSKRLEEQMLREGIILTEERVDGVYQSGDGYFLTAGQKTFEAISVILASGVETSGNLVGEKEFLGRGVSYCAVCDGALYKDKKIAVVLSSQKFAEEVEYLASFARNVYAYCLEQCEFSAQNITKITSPPLAILGEMRVNAIMTKSGEIPVDGVFLLKNSTPPSALVGGLETDGNRVLVDRNCATNLAGLFCAGDITGTPYQYVKAAGEGSVSAYSATAYVRQKRGDRK